jgi:putative ABC transport system substrate-binding protein
VRRREFITLVGATTVWPLTGIAQAMPVIGLLNAGSPEQHGLNLVAFRDGLKEGGYVEQRSVLIDYRWAEGQLTGCRHWLPTWSVAASV